MPKKSAVITRAIPVHFGQIKDSARKKQVRHTLADPYKEEKVICSSSYDGSFSVFFYVYA